MRSRILVVGQDVAVRARLARALGGAGYAVEVAESAAQARRVDRKGLSLAIVAPGGFGPDGNALVEELRAAIGPVIVLADAADEAGLLGRVAEALRPAAEADDAAPVLRFAGFSLDVAGRSLTDASEREVPLTQNEFGLLLAFAQRPGRVLSRDQLLQILAGRDAEAFDRSIDMQIVRLRRKIEPDPKNPSLIVTVTGAGYKFAAKVRQEGVVAAPKAAPAPPPPAPESAARRSRWRVLGAAGLAAALACALAVWSVWPAGRTPAPVAENAASPAEAKRLSIVVLPFANLSGDPAQDYLADVLTDDLTTGIAHIPRSFVIARNTAFTFKGKPVDAKAIGKDLGVRYVLEGSVQPSGAQLRVNAQLIDAESGAHLWAEQFDTGRADLLQTQDEIVVHLVRALELRLPEAEAARLKRAPTANPEAEDLALQCFAATVLKAAYFGATAEAGYHLCERALDGDPNNLDALNVLASKFYLAAGFGHSTDPTADFERADQMVSHVLTIDPNNEWAHINKAFMLNYRGRPGEAIPEAERALALDPALVGADGNLGWDYAALGQYEKSLAYFDKAIRLSPHDPDLDAWYSGKSANYFRLKQYDQAIEWCRRAIAINPNNNPFPHARLIAALALSGHAAEARETLQRYLALPSSGPRTIAAWKALSIQYANDPTDPGFREYLERWTQGLRVAGMAEQ